MSHSLIGSSELGPMLCKYSEPVGILTSWIKENPQQHFHGCRRYEKIMSRKVVKFSNGLMINCVIK